MLYLKQTAADAASGMHQRVPLVNDTAVRFERILLTPDRAERLRELTQTLADDRNIAVWAIRAAEQSLGCTINRSDEAAEWLECCFETKLAAALESEASVEKPAEVEWRLPALALKLSSYERQLEQFERRLEQEKLESLKELAYGASHEINNPLANIAARAQTLLEDEANAERAKKLSAIHRQAMRAHEMISDLMLFARPPKLQSKIIDVRQLARRVVDQLRDLATEYDVDLVCETGDKPIEVLADETQLGVALDALVKNALEAVGDGGNVHVAVRRTETGSDAFAEASVRDNGPGISDEVRRHMFDPFFSGREAGRGLGFGLSKCWRLVTEHGGQVVVNRPAGGGAEIGILLPLIVRSSTES